MGGKFKPGYAYVKCEITRTRLEEERAVHIERQDGGTSVALVSAEDVITGEQQGEALVQEGEVRVNVVRRIKEGFVIGFHPNQAVTTGKIPVPQAAVRF